MHSCLVIASVLCSMLPAIFMSMHVPTFSRISCQMHAKTPIGKCKFGERHNMLAAVHATAWKTSCMRMHAGSLIFGSTWALHFGVHGRTIMHCFVWITQNALTHSSMGRTHPQVHGQKDGVLCFTWPFNNNCIESYNWLRIHTQQLLCYCIIIIPL